MLWNKWIWLKCDVFIYKGVVHKWRHVHYMPTTLQIEGTIKKGECLKWSKYVWRHFVNILKSLLNNAHKVPDKTNFKLKFSRFRDDLPSQLIFSKVSNCITLWKRVIFFCKFSLFSFLLILQVSNFIRKKFICRQMGKRVKQKISFVFFCVLEMLYFDQYVIIYVNGYLKDLKT